ncbi:hypothetical protein PtB15_16B235 [Puccinia triticina]|nr:hypothetical protein PtB15_16B235 [Puccinia triticina]
MTTTTPALLLPPNAAPPCASLQQHQPPPPTSTSQPFLPATGSPSLHNTQPFLPAPSNNSPGDYPQARTMMMSQATSHHFDHHLPQQHPPQNHHRHVSNASSISSLASSHSHYDPAQYPQSYAVPVSYTGSVSADAAFGGVPGNSPEGIGAGSNVTGGRKASQIQMMRRARAQARPYGLRTDQVPWNPNDPSTNPGASNNLMRSHSVASDAPSNTEEELAQLLRSQSPNVHGHSSSYGTTTLPMNGTSSNGLGVMTGANGMANTSMVGGMGARMGRMTLDSTETYEALAHHIRTAVTTSASDRARQAFVQACFGKSVRQSFPNIKTRRLGVRGNSKYHYCGIRPATAKEAEILMNLSQSEKPEPSHNGNTPSSADDDVDSDDSPSRRVSMQPSSLSVDDSYQGMMSLDADGQQPQTPRTARPSMSSLASSQPLSHATSDSNGSDFRAPMALPSLDEVLNQPLAHDLDHQKAREFWSMYVDHSKTLLDSVKSYRFDQFELALRTFWTSMDSSSRECITHSLMMSLIYRADAVVYDEILDYLHSQTLNQMPQQAFGSLRQLAQNMEQVIIAALENFPSTFVGPKIELAARFGHLVVRNLGICQLAQALSGIFSNPANLKDMAEAWDGIDFEAVRNQAALVTNCQHEILGGCFDEFRAILNNPNVTIDHFISFVEATYKRCLQPSADGERALSPRSLLVRWCFVSSQLIRDLTLRSASSFGSFQIVNLFFDEWLGFKVLRKVALHVAAVAASVDTTGQQQQSLGPESAMYSADGSHHQASFQGFAAPANELLGAGLAASAGEHDVAHPGTDGFLFSPNTSQAFAIAQQQAQGRAGCLASPDPNGGDQTAIFAPSQVGASALYASAGDSLGGLHHDDARAADDRASRAASHPAPSASTPVDHNATASSFDDSTFKELMDVSGFSITIKNPSADASQPPGPANDASEPLSQPGAD